MPSFGDSTLHGLGTRSLQYMIPQIVDNILKKTNQSQAMTAETTAQPFRFLDLPTELQQMVLDRYFREPWIITASRSDVRDDSDLDNVASSTVRYRPSSSLFISSFLTHRKFYTQGQIASPRPRATHTSTESMKLTVRWTLPSLYTCGKLLASCGTSEGNIIEMQL